MVAVKTDQIGKQTNWISCAEYENLISVV